tara:strand:- start:858 stop:1025 length:168 start_codon:yes stop_codon:yes gene_type:complete
MIYNSIMANGRAKCSNKQGRPCKGGKKGGNNKRGGCEQKAGRPCGSKSKKPKGRK